MLEHPFIDHLCPILPRGEHYMARETGEGTWHGLCLSWLHWWTRPLLGPAYVSTSDGCSSQQSYLAAGKTQTSLGLSHLCSSSWILPLTIADFVPGWSCILKHVGSEWSLLSSWGMLGWLVVRNIPTPHAVSTHPLFPSRILTSKLHPPYKQSPGFPEPSFCLVRPSNQTRGFILSSLVMGPRDRASNMGLDHILPRGIPACVILFFFFPGDQVQTSSLPFLPYLIPLWTFPSQCCIGVFLSTPS